MSVHDVAREGVLGYCLWMNKPGDRSYETSGRDPARSAWKPFDAAHPDAPPGSSDPLRWPLTGRVGPGLDGAVATATRVSSVDGAAGALAYRGIPIESLAGAVTFEDAAGLLIEDLGPDAAPQRRERWRRRLRASRMLPAGVESILHSLPRETHPMRLLRAGVSALGCFELTPGDDIGGARQWSDYRIVGQVASLAAAVARHQQGAPARTASPDQSLAESLLDALGGGSPDQETVAALDLCLVVCADQGMDAPTFTSMVVGSCRADPYYNVVAGLSALSGPRVGGAAEAVLRLLLEQSDPDEAKGAVQRIVERGERVPGFGHRVYRTLDPRVPILRERAKSLAVHTGKRSFLEIALAFEDEASRQLAPRGIKANVNLYAAVVLHLLGAEPALVPCVISAGRVAGLVARVREYLEANRLFRPEENYVGPPERPFIALEER
ncbi:MAG: hypothetical protein GF355_05805 [Candidatus Eisenbacteria bacterium]|nr:hypothetical protein [Candidatus Eisenbacteria bacterium]